MAKPTEAPIVNVGRGPGRPGGGPGGPGGPMQQRMHAEKPQNMMNTLKRLFRYIGKSKYFLISLLMIMLFSTGLTIVAPLLQGEAIDTIKVDADGGVSLDAQALLYWLLLLGIVYAVSALLAYFQGLLAAYLSQNTVQTMRRDLFAKIEKLPISYMDSHPHGDIMSRMTNDVENVSNTISQSIASLFSGVLTLVGVFVIMLTKSWILTLVSLATIPLTLLVSGQLAKHMRKYFVKQQTLLGELNGHVEEMVTGYKTVVAYGKEQDSVKAFSDISDNLKNCGIKAQVMGSLMGPCMNFIGNLGFLLIAAAGGLLAWEGVITIGVIQVFLNYSKQFTRPINELANQYTQIMTALAGAERVFAIMDSEPEVDTGTYPLEIENIRGNIDFKNIDFSYVPGEPVLKNFRLWVKPGQKIAIVGATGSGKTTVVNLLTRFYEVDAGCITLDDVDIRDIPKDTLRKAIAIVLQDTVLFSDTVANNIRYGNPEASMEDVKRAAKIAKADQFIERLADGYDTMLSESGGNLSQGQRQLLTIARAVLADPKILILDEATSSVDTRTEMQIQEAMIALMKNRTSLIIAHRLSTIRDADKIVVIDDGQVREAGNHEELLTQKGCYYRLYQNQFAGLKT